MPYEARQPSVTEMVPIHKKSCWTFGDERSGKCFLYSSVNKGKHFLIDRAIQGGNYDD